jgi:hypothetical protein
MELLTLPMHWCDIASDVLPAISNGKPVTYPGTLRIQLAVAECTESLVGVEKFELSDDFVWGGHPAFLGDALLRSSRVITAPRVCSSPAFWGAVASECGSAELCSTFLAQAFRPLAYPLAIWPVGAPPCWLRGPRRGRSDSSVIGRSRERSTLEWFYERARGQYADALSREGTPARQRKFKQEHPSRQKFTKTDLAKFENTWDQLPHVVSRGAQKSFAEFTLRLSSRGRVLPDAEYFYDLVAKAILFRRTERLIAEQHYGGYRANIVTYTLAYLAHLSAHRIDLDRIWREQGVSEALAESIVEVSRGVQPVLTKPPGGANITEWAKKEACWERVRDLGLELPELLEPELISLEHSRKSKPVTGINAPDHEERELIEELAKIPGETWFEISHWAKETNNLQGWQRKLAFSLGRLAKQGRDPSRKQAVQGNIILEEAKRLGFRGSDSS